MTLGSQDLKGGRPVFEKADCEKSRPQKTFISFNSDKNLWRMSVSPDSQGDFAKVKEPAELPWLVSKPWRVFSDANIYEEAMEADLVRVVHKRVAVRASASTSAEIIGVEAKGAVIAGKLTRAKGGQLWLKVKSKGWMLVDGSSLGLGKLLEVLPGIKVRVGRVGDRLWQSPLRELRRPDWAPRTGYAALSGGLSATGWRNIWVFGGVIPGLGYSDDIWRSVDGGATWALVDAQVHWSPRSEFGCCGGSTAPEPRPKGVIYVVGGQGAPGLLGDVWASDTAGRTWARMCGKAGFGARAQVACATVPGKPLVLIVAGGISDDVHRDAWVSQDGGVSFSLLSLTMPIGCSLMKWPPGLLCASRAVSGRLGLWSLRLKGSSAELEPLDEFSQSFDCECSHDFPKPPRFGLDLEAQLAISFDKASSALQVQPLPDPKGPFGGWDCEPEMLEISCPAPADAYVVCDMDALHTRGHGKVHLLTEEKCFCSDRQQYRAQDHFIKLLGLRLAAVYGMPWELWLGRVRTCLLPRPRRVAGLSPAVPAAARP
ncbi:unnamed protein product [Effrenium voratum]|nr:unnamed protein product [Effrenium voratum]